MAAVPLLLAELLFGVPGRVLWVWAWLPLAVGLALRAWGVGHLGARSRTRDSATWELVRSGPFARVRNPLYLGNGLIWLGVGLVCGSTWVAAWALFLGVLSPLVVGWEEQHLAAALGDPYRRYLEEVPRWLPSKGPGGPPGRWSALEVLRGERSTWLAVIIVMAVLLARTLIVY